MPNDHPQPAKNIKAGLVTGSVRLFNFPGFVPIGAFTLGIGTYIRDFI